MASLLARVGWLAFRTLLALVGFVLLPLRALGWVVMELSGGNRAIREVELVRVALRARPPMPDEQFIASLGLDLNDAAVAVAVRRAIAHNCYLPDNALRPTDSVTEIERMFVTPPPDAPWYDVGGSWLQVLLLVEIDTPVRFRDSLLTSKWEAARLAGRVETLRDAVRFFVSADSRLPDRRPR